MWLNPYFNKICLALQNKYCWWLQDQVLRWKTNIVWEIANIKLYDAALLDGSDVTLWVVKSQSQLVRTSLALENKYCLLQLHSSVVM